jgi:hypothetical protein
VAYHADLATFLNIREYVAATSRAHRRVMASSNYDVNVQLVLATTAEDEGDLGSALDFLVEARRAARDDREARAQVSWHAARLHARRRAGLASLHALAAVL